jgi:hypothetical protein
MNVTAMMYCEKLKILRAEQQTENCTMARMYDVSENCICYKTAITASTSYANSKISSSRKKFSSYLNQRWQFDYEV